MTSPKEGLATSQYILGSLYAQGRGVTQDYAEAARIVSLHGLAATTPMRSRNS